MKKILAVALIFFASFADAQIRQIPRHDHSAANRGGSTLAPTTFTAGNLTATSVALGTTPATVGAVRIPTEGVITARNAANTANVVLINSTAGNRVEIDRDSNGTTISGNLTTKRITGSGTTPTCGAGCSIVTGNDMSMVINGAAVAPAAIQITFAVAWTSAPVCIAIISQTNNAALVKNAVSTTTTLTLQPSMATFGAGIIVNAICMGV